MPWRPQLAVRKLWLEKSDSNRQHLGRYTTTEGPIHPTTKLNQASKKLRYENLLIYEKQIYQRPLWVRDDRLSWDNYASLQND